MFWRLSPPEKGAGFNESFVDGRGEGVDLSSNSPWKERKNGERFQASRRTASLQKARRRRKEEPGRKKKGEGGKKRDVTRDDVEGTFDASKGKERTDDASLVQEREKRKRCVTIKRKRRLGQVEPHRKRRRAY